MVSLASNLESLDKASGNVSRIFDFLQGGQAVQILEEVGTRHMQAAILALEDTTRSYKPRDRVNSAANSLIEAYAHIAPRYQNVFVKFIRESNTIGVEFQVESYSRAAVCATLIAMCYKFLGESRENIRLWLDRAEEDLGQWSYFYIGSKKAYWKGSFPIVEAREADYSYVKEVSNNLTKIRRKLLKL